jgi:hypothetical protein
MKIDLNQLEFIHQLLREITCALEERFGEKTITSLYRIGDKGVHGMLPLRGIDLRCTSKEHGEEVEKWVNDKWVYNPNNPEKNCCLFHNVGSGYHLHLQVHPNTRRRKINTEGFFD